MGRRVRRPTIDDVEAEYKGITPDELVPITPELLRAEYEHMKARRAASNRSGQRRRGPRRVILVNRYE